MCLGGAAPDPPKIQAPPPAPTKPAIDEEELARQRRNRELKRTGFSQLRIDPALPTTNTQQGSGLSIPQ